MRGKNMARGKIHGPGPSRRVQRVSRKWALDSGVVLAYVMTTKEGLGSGAPELSRLTLDGGIAVQNWGI